jgi:HEAT repeat protein
MNDKLQNKIQELIQQLNSRDRRERAIHELVKIEKAAFPWLILALGNKDEDENVRGDIAFIFEKIAKNHPNYDWKDVVSALIKAIKDFEGESELHESAEYALVEIGKSAVPALIDALKDETYWVRWRSAEALGEIAGKKPNYDLREAIPALIEALKDVDGDVKEQAAWALGNIGVNDEQLETILGMLINEGSDGAAEALGEIGDSRAVPVLIDALKDENSGVQNSAAGALGKIGDVSAVPALIDALNNKNWRMQYRAAWALGNIGVNDEQLETIIQMLRHGDEYTRRGIAEALGEIGDSRAVDPLMGLLDDPKARRVALNALKKLGKAALESMSRTYVKGKITYEEFDHFCNSLNIKLTRENFDKGCVAPPKKKPDDLKRIMLPKKETQNPRRILRGVANA